MQKDKPEYLYHGSVVSDIKVLEPRKRHTPDASIEYDAIYATPLPAYAVAHSFPWESPEGFDIDIANEKVTLIVPEKYKNRLQVPIYIYKVPSDTFIQTKEELTGYTWHSTEPVEVVEVTGYNNIEEVMNVLGGEIVYV